jgi:hypothetical protein
VRHSHFTTDVIGRLPSANTEVAYEAEPHLYIIRVKVIIAHVDRACAYNACRPSARAWIRPLCQLRIFRHAIKREQR